MGTDGAILIAGDETYIDQTLEAGQAHILKQRGMQPFGIGNGDVPAVGFDQPFLEADAVELIQQDRSRWDRQADTGGTVKKSSLGRNLISFGPPGAEPDEIDSGHVFVIAIRPAVQF